MGSVEVQSSLQRPDVAVVIQPENSEVPSVLQLSEAGENPTRRNSKEPVVLLTDRLPLLTRINPLYYVTAIREAATYHNPHKDVVKSTQRAGALVARAGVLWFLPLPGLALRSVLAMGAWVVLNPKDAFNQVAQPVKILGRFVGDHIGAGVVGVKGMVAAKWGNKRQSFFDNAKAFRTTRQEGRSAKVLDRQRKQFAANHKEEVTQWVEKYSISEEDATAYLMQKEFVDTHKDRIVALATLFPEKSLSEVLPTLMSMVQDENALKQRKQMNRALLRLPEAVVIGAALTLATVLLAEFLPLAFVAFGSMLVFSLIMRYVIPRIEHGFDQAREVYVTKAKSRRYAA